MILIYVIHVGTFSTPGRCSRIPDKNRTRRSRILNLENLQLHDEQLSRERMGVIYSLDSPAATLSGSPSALSSEPQGRISRRDRGNRRKHNEERTLVIFCDSDG